MKSLRQIRREKNLTLNDIAELIGVTRANVSLYERGIVSPQLSTRQRLEQFFGEPLNWIDTPAIDDRPREEPCSWNDTEREFRYFLHMVASLKVKQRRDFINAVIRHLQRLRDRGEDE